MLRHIEPQAPLLGGASADILQNWDSIDCRRIDHLTPLRVQATELAKNVKTLGNNGRTGWTGKQQQTTTLSEPTSVDVDAIETDMNARAGDAGLIPWLLVQDCAPQLSFCARHSGRVLSRWWCAPVYDTDCLQPLKQTHGCPLWSSGNRWCR